MSSALPAPPADRCPRCSGHVRAGSAWCTLCYADLRPAKPEPAPVAAAVVPAAVEPGAADGAPAPATAVRRGKHARRAPVDVDAVADQLLAELAAAESRNPLGPVSGAVDTTGKKVILMVGGTVVAMVLLFALMAGVGALL